MISLRVDSLMRAPTHRRNPGSAPPPIRHPARAFGNGATRSRDPPVSVPYGHGAPATPPCAPARPAKARPVSIPGFRFRSAAGRAPRGALPWPARALREDARGGTLAGDVRHTAATGPPRRPVPRSTTPRAGSPPELRLGCPAATARSAAPPWALTNPRAARPEPWAPTARSAPTAGTPSSCAAPTTPPPPLGSFRLPVPRLG